MQSQSGRYRYPTEWWKSKGDSVSRTSSVISRASLRSGIRAPCTVKVIRVSCLMGKTVGANDGARHRAVAYRLLKLRLVA